LAERLLADSIAKQAVVHGQLTIHADRGASMVSRPVAFLLADLGVTKRHSRPHCSNDNPYSEDRFKTLKYRPEPMSTTGGPSRSAPSGSSASHQPHRSCPLSPGSTGPQGRPSAR
jgi:transposase InsO family protein